MKTHLTEFCTFLKSENVFVEEINSKDVIQRFIDQCSLGSYGMADIIEIVSRISEVSVDEIKRRTSEPRIVEARQMAMWMMRHYTIAGYRQIGYAFRSRQHTFAHCTALYSCANVDKFREIEVDYNNRFEKIRTEVAKQFKLRRN